MNEWTHWHILFSEQRCIVHVNQWAWIKKNTDVNEMNVRVVVGEDFNSRWIEAQH